MAPTKVLQDPFDDFDLRQCNLLILLLTIARGRCFGNALYPALYPPFIRLLSMDRLAREENVARLGPEILHLRSLLIEGADNSSKTLGKPDPMPASFPAAPPPFVGREEQVSRFKSRCDHFRFFAYAGIAGIGKTSLLLRLAKEARAVGVTQAIYLRVNPGEAITSLLARVEARFKSRTGGASDRQGDQYSRLLELLAARKVVLLLDSLQNLRIQDLPPIVRATRYNDGPFRIIAASRGDPELSAMDRVLTHMERLGPLLPDEVVALGKKAKLSPENLEILNADAIRGGCSGHPLTLRYILGLYAPDELPAAEFLAHHSARSVNAFRVLLSEAGDRLGEEERQVMANLARIAEPIGKAVATQVLGAKVPELIKRGLLDVVAGDVTTHPLVGQVFTSELDLKPPAANKVAEHLKRRGVTHCEPVGVIRAGEILALTGKPDAAVDLLADGWEPVRELGFLEAYLKTLAAIDRTPSLEPRIRLLSARARMRQGNPSAVRAEMEDLAKSHDDWTRSRALAALTFIYSELRQHNDVLTSFEALTHFNPGADLLIPAGSAAAAAMVRVAKVNEAEKLAKSLLAKLRGKDSEREGALRRLLARVYAQGGHLTKAVEEADKAAQAFEKAGDLYHAATAFGFIGDLHREAGEFELAQKAFVRFHELAATWGDRDLIQIAELADAWVSLDVGDLTHAAKQIEAVEKELSAAPSRRLRRYLAAAKALCEAGRGHHGPAATALARVVEAWDSAGQRAIADVLRAQQVRSLIASGRLDEARKIVDDALKRLDAKSAAPRVASFLRESALIRLRRKDVKTAMEELTEACKLFSKGGNRREEALTLYRIAHAAFEEGDEKLASERAADALALGRRIKHSRAIALARELQGRIALNQDKAKPAITCIKEAQQSLRKLGDELGVLHVSVSLLEAQVVAGDLAAAIRLGPKVRDHADRLDILEIKVRAVALTGVALLRRARLDQAAKCFRELPARVASPRTVAVMWRLGEALAALEGDAELAADRRARWVAALRRLPEQQQEIALHNIEQLVLPPRQRAELRTAAGKRMVGTESCGWVRPEDYSLFADLLTGLLVVKGTSVNLGSSAGGSLLGRLLACAPEAMSNEDAAELVAGSAGGQREATRQKKLAAAIADLQKLAKAAKGLKLTVTKSHLKVTLPKTYALLIPALWTVEGLSEAQQRIVEILGKVGTAPLQKLQDDLALSRTAARREVGVLVDAGQVEAVRDGRGQAFRLA